MFVWHAHDNTVTALAFGPGGRLLVSTGGDERVKVWDPFTGAEQFAISLRPEGHIYSPAIIYRTLRWLTLSGDGTRAALAVYQRGLVFLDLDRGEQSSTRPFADVLAVKPAPDRQSAFALTQESASGALTITQYRFADGFPLATLAPSSWPRPQSLGVAPDGTHVAVGSAIYDWPPASTYHPHRRMQMRGYSPDDLAFSADMQHLFALVGGKVIVYALETALLKTKLKGHNGRITAMALTPDGRRLWTASHDATVKCWDTHSLTLDRTFTFQTGGLDCLAVSPDGNVAAVGSGQKGTITVWDLG